MGIEIYLNMVDDETKQKVLPIIQYIEKTYPDAMFDEQYSSKTKIPTYRLGERFVKIACRKRYITVHFKNPEAVKTVTDASEKVRGNVASVNIGYRTEIPYSAIYAGIDKNFS